MKKILLALPLLFVGCTPEKSTDQIIMDVLSHTSPGYCSRVALKYDGAELTGYLLVCKPEEK